MIKPEAALNRVLDALERELIAATDEEVLEAAKDLGMNPLMKGSAAFLGLHNFSFAEFFDSEVLREVLGRARHIAAASQLELKGKARQPKAGRAGERKGAADK
ncbi:MAG TPA: hypothetical protein VGJ20_18850 [Xanthobacteraceae bacterium]